MRRISEEGQYFLAAVITGLVGLVLGVAIMSARGSDEGWAGCPPQNMLDGADFRIDFTYEATPEDLQWTDDASAYFEECDKTAEGINGSERAPSEDEGSGPNAG